ncbi:MAG: OpgC domain-containing protein [Acidobacteriia bacterium]|nr:OpgC domain-containing protein [Terriglobia bacterium]
MQRDWRVDTLRGYFLVAMSLGHFPNPLARFTEYTFGYASAPDGFVFLSGLVSSWVYLPLRQRSGNSAMVSKVFRRTGTIYLTHIALLVLGILVVLSPGTGMHRATHPLQTFVSGALLWNQVGFARILPMYCVFLAFSPIVLKQFTEGRAWLIGVISASLWVGAQFGLGDSRSSAAGCVALP